MIISAVKLNHSERIVGSANDFSKYLVDDKVKGQFNNLKEAAEEEIKCVDAL